MRWHSLDGRAHEIEFPDIYNRVAYPPGTFIYYRGRGAPYAFRWLVIDDGSIVDLETGKPAPKTVPFGYMLRTEDYDR